MLCCIILIKMCTVQIKTRVQRSALNLEGANLAKLSNYFDCSNKQFYSIEVCANRSINKELLKKLTPKFCSVPWHHTAQISEQNLLSHSSILLTESLIRDGYTVLQHIPCGYLNRTQAFCILDHLVSLKVRDIFVIRGDLQTENREQHEFKFASCFVKFVKQFYGNFFFIGVAGYVDSHPLSPNQNHDLKFLKEKVDSGADFIITQMVFDFDSFYKFCNKCKDIGINIPIIPGLYIIHSWNEFVTLSRLCKVNVSQEVVNKMLGYRDNNQQDISEYGLHLTRKFIVQMLKANDLTTLNVHFFSLNNFELVEQTHIFNSDVTKIDK